MTKGEAVQVLDKTLQLLNEPSKWKKESSFEEACNEAGEDFTLSCALKTAHRSVLGPQGFGSRTMVMVKLRWRIRRYFLLRHGIHPITHFNQHKKTTYADVIFILNKAKEAFAG